MEKDDEDQRVKQPGIEAHDCGRIEMVRVDVGIFGLSRNLKMRAAKSCDSENMMFRGRGVRIV